MKNLLIAVSVMAAGAATAQEAPMSVGNTYVELGTTFEDQTTLTVGTGVGSGALSAYGELSGSTDGNFQARAYTDVRVWQVCHHSRYQLRLGRRRWRPCGLW